MEYAYTITIPGEDYRAVATTLKAVAKETGIKIHVLRYHFKTKNKKKRVFNDKYLIERTEIL